MTKKYIVKNCPSFIDFDEQSLFENLCKNGGNCQDCTDCVMKQIFLETYKLANNLDEKITIDNIGTNFQKAMETLTKIRKLLDIQEVE